VVQLDPSASFADVVRSLPAASDLPPPGRSEAAGEAQATAASTAPIWRRLIGPAVAVTAGLTGAAPVSSVLIAGCALPIARRAMASVRRRHLGIDVLDTLAVGLLLGVGDVTAAGVSVGLIESGERLREAAVGRARRVLRSWMIADTSGVRVVRNGSEPRIPAVEVVPGDSAVVYAGEVIPVDGLVAAGNAEIDERTWTGEPLPRSVGRGDQVLAGSTVVNGRIVLTVLASGEATRAGRLAAALEEAIAAHTPTTDMARRLADRLAIPVLLVGGGVYAGTRDLSRLASLLIVDFGTGIRVGVPTPILTTMIAGARKSVLFRTGRGIEKLAHVDTIVFDKTGTLTTGHPRVIGVVPLGSWDEVSVLRAAAAAEGHLPHPLARAIRRAARRRGLELPEPETAHYQAGGGVEATIDGRRVLVGHPRLLAANGIAVPAPSPSSSAILVAIDGELAGRVRLRDHVREDAGRTVAALRRGGVETLWLATGDRAGAARAVARQLGLDGFDAAMLPEDKAALVQRMRAEGRIVAVVGDGINDATAMAEADVSVAVHRGADLARETADVVLASEDLATLVTARDMSRQAMRLVRQNIALVAAPNAVALGVAAFVGLRPLLATAVNNGSTLVAGLNGLRPLR
jgi:Cu2+-exporting ATPase